VLPLLFFIGPLVALVWRTLPSGRWVDALGSPIVGQALLLSLGTTTVSLAASVLLGTPLAYLLARHSFPGRRFVDTAVDLPMVLPPAVAGLALLMLFGRAGLLGPTVRALGIDVAFSTAAVVIAQTFVAGPFYIRSARAGFESVDPQLERVAATLGEGEGRIFWRITVPLAFPSLVSGAVMTWARALGEFGATIMFAGNFPGRTQTMPLAVYTALESDLWTALTVAMVLVCLSFSALGILKLAASRTPSESHAS
jgi:molybdate transport system permease protein